MAIKITNVKILMDGSFSGLSDVYLVGNKIDRVHKHDAGADSAVSEKYDELETIDGKEGYLIPGLIDAHVHLDGVETLALLSKWGVTTGLDMAFGLNTKHQNQGNQKGLADVRSAGIPATAPGSNHSRMPLMPPESILKGPEEAAKFVADRVADGSDYIKIISDVPGPDQETLNALVKQAHDHRKLVVAHAARFAAYDMALKAGADIITHVPMDRALDDQATSSMLKAGRFAVPTLIMEKGLSKVIPGMNYSHSYDSVVALHKAGVPIIAGSDANRSKMCPVPHGESLHMELELLVEAGLSTKEALHSATLLAAQTFGLNDRGAIKSSLRADLVLLKENPLDDIKATRSIQKIWCGGIEATF
jgi:imidazolonepropionase-like amidohydrolase